MGWLVAVLTVISLVAVGGCLGYLYVYGRREQERVARETREQKEAFQKALVDALKRNPRDFDLAEFALRCEVPESISQEVVEGMFAKLARRVHEDGVVTPVEQASLDRLAQLLSLGPERIERIVGRARQDHYGSALAQVMADGRIDRDEAARLESLQRSLGLSRRGVRRASGEMTNDAYVALFRQLALNYGLEVNETGELAAARQALGLSREEAAKLVHGSALALFEELVVIFAQDGEISAAEEAHLAWVQSEAELSSAEVEPFRRRIEHTKELAAIRSGQLPVYRTRKLLEGGEICHWEGRCRHLVRAGEKFKDFDGDLTVTSARLLFNSPTRSFEFRPAKIVNVRLARGDLIIETSMRQGTGAYEVGDAERVAAIVEGVARRHKYLAVENYSTTATRHIPDDVKRAVWARDGGRCVKCGAHGRGAYLEYDHDIPHSKGGANTEKNVRLLCRGCNLAKGDRI